MKKTILLAALASAVMASAADQAGVLSLTAYPGGAVRVRLMDSYVPIDAGSNLFYTAATRNFDSVSDTPTTVTATLNGYTFIYGNISHSLTVIAPDGSLLTNCSVVGIPSKADGEAKVVFTTAPGERIYGGGQFQDGHLDINGVTRRLTQVNTQIAVPMVLSNRGYGVLWNNYGLTDFNPSDFTVTLEPIDSTGESEEVDATGTSGNHRERRDFATFAADIDVAEAGDYSLLLDVGQQMARRHQMWVDGTPVCDARNVWLPPTNSVTVSLTPGTHRIEVVGEKNDKPTVGVRRADGTMTFASPVAEAVDFTIFTGDADRMIDQYRRATGEVPLMPAWGLGYTHCRERYVSQDDLLANATEFRRRDIPIDLIVQDWQYWGKYGWNAMRFDEEYYPDPKAMTDSLHNMDIRMMASVWAKVDRNSELGRKMAANGYYIDDRCDWIDFFNPEAAEAYVKGYNDYLLPAGIDAWWQDATEPENDDLHGRKVNRGTIDGDIYRNVFPLIVNDHVYKGMEQARPGQRQMILTRSGAPGIQRYGVTTWSGDVGNDWQTLAYQLYGGMGQMATGLPWWTYDAGGFFRPGNQYTNADYQECMLRWIEASVFLPLMRVHGYMSQTEPWRYSDSTRDAFVKNIRLRYSLLPYIYSEASRVSSANGTLMRPLVFDFADDTEALTHAEKQPQYMFGPALLVCPVVEPGCKALKVYLPQVDGGWYRMGESAAISGGRSVNADVTADAIPVYVRAGSILPWRDSEGVRSSVDALNSPALEIKVYPGADGTFTLVEDDGVTTDGDRSEITFTWRDASRTLEISPRKGTFTGMPAQRTFTVTLPDGTAHNLTYTGKAAKVRM